MKNISPDVVHHWIADPEIRCLKDVIVSLGMNPHNAGSYRIINNWAKINDVNLSPLKKQGYGRTQKPTIWEYHEIFANPSAFPNDRLCDKLIEIGVPYLCSRCGTFEWLGKPLRLHVDHISANSVDNSLENLRFLCPNCHSQITKYKNARNQCETCGCATSNPQFCNYRCVPREGTPEPYSRSKKRPSMDVLIQELEDSSWTAVARKYDVSTHSVRKWARFYGIDPKKVQTAWRQEKLS